MTYGPEDFAAEYDVSRETMERLKAHEALLLASPHNLVARSTIPDRWERHYRDSAQLYALIPENARTLIDLGSGAGFPGLVLAAMAADAGTYLSPSPVLHGRGDRGEGKPFPDAGRLPSPTSPHPRPLSRKGRERGVAIGLDVTLIESTGKKAAFLAEAVAAMRLTNAKVIAKRIEDVRLPPADVVTARALAPLDRLLAYAVEFADEKTVLILHKGQDVGAELTAAAKSWHMTVEKQASATSPDSAILVIRRLRARHARDEAKFTKNPRDRQPERRRRQDDDRDQSVDGARRGRRKSLAHRP